MGESGKAVAALVMIVGMIGSVFVWMDDSDNWPLRIAFPAGAVGSLGILIGSLTRKDRVPDLLRAGG